MCRQEPDRVSTAHRAIYNQYTVAKIMLYDVYEKLALAVDLLHISTTKLKVIQVH